MTFALSMVLILATPALGQLAPPAAEATNATAPTTGPDVPPPPPPLLTPPANSQADLEARVSQLEQALQGTIDRENAAQQKASEKPSCTVTGVIDFDTAFFDQDHASEIQFPPGSVTNDAVGFRRLRLGVYGDAFDNVFYRLELDFAPYFDVLNSSGNTQIADETVVKSAYVGLKDVPFFGDVRVGHIKEPFSLEHVNRDRYGTFMERSLPDQGNLVPLRSPGIEAYNYAPNERMSWQIGAFTPDVQENPPIFLGVRGGAAVTGRVTLLPFYDEDSGARYLHLGAAYSYRQNATGNLLYTAYPECNFGPAVVTTKGYLDGANGDVASNQLLGTELALIEGPWCFQGEYCASYVDRERHPDVMFYGYYGYVTYFLTGEHKPYAPKRGDFDRLEPLQNFVSTPGSQGTTYSGMGAWQVGYRYSTLDLNDGLVQGGQIGAHTLGVNWYLNAYTRLMFNYVVANVDRNVNGVPAGTMQVFETRVHFDF